MGEITTVGLDIAKRIFVAHGADAAGNTVLTKKLRREEVLTFFASLPPCLVGMEACATSHYWAREIAVFGHDTRLIPPIYVKAYVVRQNNDFVDAAAICEAVTRPSVRQTPVKTVEPQTARVTQRTHELLSRQRVTLINALRGHMAEFGILAPAGPQHVGRLVEKLADPAAPIPGAARDALNVIVDQLVALGREIDRMEAQMRRSCRSEENAARLLTIPGVGPITASAIIAGVPNIHGFRSGRDFAAWLGLVPRQNSSGGKERLGRHQDGRPDNTTPFGHGSSVGHTMGPSRARLFGKLDWKADRSQADEARRRGARQQAGENRLGVADARRGLSNGIGIPPGFNGSWR